VTEDGKLTDEKIVDQARTFVRGVLERMDIQAEVTVSEGEDKIVLNVQCDNVERVIGRRGQVIDALQHLVGKAVTRDRPVKGKPIVVDAGDYRTKQIERLEGLAVKMGEKALQTGAPVRLSPMSAHDRRIIHMKLATVDGVSTHSEGEGEDRHIVVSPASAGQAKAAT
jgi:spoIIIJ-associated protein